MKPVKIESGTYRITKGKTTVDILTADYQNIFGHKSQDKRILVNPIVIVDSQRYVSKLDILSTVAAFRNCYSEEQVLETVLELI